MDGYFNRSLVPSSPFASGLKAGKQIAKMKAVETFRESLRALCPTLTEEQEHQAVEHFEHQLVTKIQ